MSPQTLKALYNRHGPSVLRRARQILGDEDDAMDVLHDIFVSLARNPKQFGARSQIATWLYSTTTNACLNRLRNVRTRARLLDQRFASRRTAYEPARGIDHVFARELLASLPRELAQVAIYYYCDEMTQREVAEVLG